MRVEQLFLWLALFPLWALAAPLATAPAETVQVAREFRLDGTVEAVKQSTVSAQTQGQVKDVLVDVNDVVKKGQLIVRLDATEQRARVERAAAELKQAVAELQKARQDHARTRSLFKRKLASKAAMDQAEAALKTRRARFEAAQAALAQAQEQLSYTRVKAPYSGIVIRRQVEPGEMARPGTPLMTGISLERLRVVVDVPQGLIAQVRKYRQARILLPDGRWVPAGRMTIFPFADFSTNTFRVRLDLPEGVQGLFPGMFVKVAFVTGEKRVLSIPREAVAYRSEVTGVYVLDDQGRLHFRRVRLGHGLDAERIAVLAGLEPGERVALDPVAATVALKHQGREPAHD